VSTNSFIEKINLQKKNAIVPVAQQRFNLKTIF